MCKSFNFFGCFIYLSIHIFIHVLYNIISNFLLHADLFKYLMWNYFFKSIQTCLTWLIVILQQLLYSHLLLLSGFFEKFFINIIYGCPILLYSTNRFLVTSQTDSCI